MHSDYIGELTPEEQRTLAALNAEIAAPTWRGNPKRKRQTYRPRYRAMFADWRHRYRAYAAFLAPTDAAAKQRSLNLKEGQADTPSPPPPDHLIEWYRRKIIRDFRDGVERALADFYRSHGIDEIERRRAQSRNSKLRRSAETYRSGEDRSQLYNTERKLMSPEEMKAHDNAKAAKRMRKYREREREEAKALGITLKELRNIKRNQKDARS